MVGDHEEIQSVQDGLIHPGGRPDIAVGENGVGVHVTFEGQVALDIRNDDPVGHHLGSSTQGKSDERAQRYKYLLHILIILFLVT